MKKLMTLRTFLARVALAGLLCAVGGAGKATAREVHEDKEIRGTIMKVDERDKTIKVDRGPQNKIKYIQWTRKTRVYQDEKKASVKDLKEGQQVRVYYSDDIRETGTEGAVANKIVIEPTSSPKAPRYNK